MRKIFSGKRQPEKAAAGGKKLDRKFILASALVIAALVCCSLLVQSEEVQRVKESPLPSSTDNNIHELVISELVSNNGGIYVNENSEKCDYLELYNGTSQPIDLDGYGLSDTSSQIKWAFSNVTIQPGEYLVVGLTGRLESGNNAAFKLRSSGGEQVILTNAAGKVIDAVTTEAMAKNQAMMRDKDGQWFLCAYGTPGFPNSEQGLEDYYASLHAEEEPELVINEFLTRDRGNYFLSDGSYAGFVEVKNISDHSVELSEYSLGRSETAPFLYTLPQKTLGSGQVFAVFTGGRESDTRTGFQLDSTDGTVILSHKGKIVSSYSYNGLTSGMAVMRCSDGSYAKCAVSTMGYENNADGAEKFQSAYCRNPGGLMINELMNSNDAYLSQNGGEYYDWVELKNNSDETILLSDYALAKNPDGSGGYTLPDVQLEPGGLFVVMCSGNVNLTNQSYCHASFKIAAADSLFLVHGNSVQDSVFVGDVPAGYSYGRGSSNGWLYMDAPSPLEENHSGIRMVAPSPQADQAEGVYNGVGSVTVALQGSGRIYYTLDGSVPTADAHLYEGPITLQETTVLRAVSSMDGALDSEVMSRSYIINENDDVAVVSITADPYDLNYLNRNPGIQGLEIPATFTLIENGQSVSAGCSLALFGGNARWLAMKPYGIRFKSEYGDAQLEYPVFANRDNSVYQGLVLRNGSTAYDEAVINDVLATSLVDDYTDVDVQAYKPCAVYFNGEYWGFYFLREKINKYFVSEHYNVSPESVNLCRIDEDVQAGSYEGYAALRQFARTHDLSIEENYNYLAERIDMTNLCDYWIAEMYTGNNDILNCRFFMSEEYDGKWRYIYYDQDYAYVTAGRNYYTSYIGNPSGYGVYTWEQSVLNSEGNVEHVTVHNPETFENDLIYNLLQSSQFRELWLERLSYNMKNTWAQETVLARIDQLENVMSQEMQKSCGRWGLSYSNWQSCVDALRDWARTRPDEILRWTKSYFQLSEEQMRGYFGDLW